MKFNSTVFLVTIILLSACQNKKANPQPTPTPPTVVDITIAGLQPISNTVEVNGTVVANEFVELHAETAGKLTYLQVPEDSRIEKGTLIAKINDADLQAQLNKTNVLLSFAKKTEERNRKLLAINAINEADYETALNAVNSYKADAQYTQSLIDKTVLKAPFSGLMGLRQVSIGAYITPATVIATLQQVDKLKIDFNVPETYSKDIKKGKQVEVLLAGGNAMKKATIIATEPQANISTRNLKVRAMLNDAIGNPGGFAKVVIHSNENNKGILIPTNSLVANDKTNQAVLIKNGKAKFVDVKTGVRLANVVEITKGIVVGDSVVVSGVLFARPNGVVKVRKVN